MFRPILVITVILVAAVAGCTTPEADSASADSLQKTTYTIAIQPTDTPARVEAAAKELEAYLETYTGADVEILIPLSYAGVIDALRMDSADAALMGAWPAQLAVATADSAIVLAESREVLIDQNLTVAPHYYSHFVVRADSPYETLEDLRGKSVAFTTRSSTSGYVYPVARLAERGLIPAATDDKPADARAFFGNVLFAGGYGQAWEALDSEQVDVAVIAGDVKESLYREVLGNTRIIETQGPIPSHAVVFSNDLQGDEREDLRAALLMLKDERRDLMRNLVSGIFVEFEPADDTHVESLSGALQLGGFRYGDSTG